MNPPRKPTPWEEESRRIDELRERLYNEGLRLGELHENHYDFWILEGKIWGQLSHTQFFGPYDPEAWADDLLKNPRSFADIDFGRLDTLIAKDGSTPRLEELAAFLREDIVRQRAAERERQARRRREGRKE